MVERKMLLDKGMDLVGLANLMEIGSLGIGKRTRHGIGKIVTGYAFEEIEEVYIGEWKFDNQHGVGRYTSEDGHFYEGEWVNDNQNGVGFYRFPDGSQYEGEWKMGMVHGIGHWENLEISHVGEWVEGKRHGIAIITRKKDNATIFEGRFIDDKPEILQQQ